MSRYALTSRPSSANSIGSKNPGPRARPSHASTRARGLGRCGAFGLSVVGQQLPPDLDVPVLHLRQSRIDIALVRVALRRSKHAIEERGVRLVLPVVGKRLQVGRRPRPRGGLQSLGHAEESKGPGLGIRARYWGPPARCGGRSPNRPQACRGDAMRRPPSTHRMHRSSTSANSRT